MTQRPEEGQPAQGEGAAAEASQSLAGAAAGAGGCGVGAAAGAGGMRLASSASPAGASMYDALGPAPGRSWWPVQFVLGWLNLALTAPVIYLYASLPLVLRQEGWSGSSIGLLQLAALPAILKFLLAAPVERYRATRDGYRWWAAGLMAAYAALLMVLAGHDAASTSFGVLFALVVGVNVLAAWADIPVNALAIQWLPERERFRAGAIRSAATSLGAIAGGGLALLLQARLGWSAPFMALAACLVLGLAGLAALRLPAGLEGRRGEARSRRDVLNPAPVPRPSWRALRDYFAEPRQRLWAGLLLLYFPFIGAAWIFLKPLLFDQGFSGGSVAWIAGVAGGLVGAVASLLAARATRCWGVAVTLPVFAIGNLLAVAALAAAVLAAAAAPWFVAAALLVALAMGASAGLVFGMMMYFTRPGLSAFDYGLQSSLFIIARTLVPAAAGVLLDRGGYGGMLAGLLMGLLLALGLAWWGRNRL